MSFGFSVGDFIAAIQLATDLWTTCFSEVSGAKIAYIRYGEQVKGLGSSLQSLMQILNDHEKNLQRRRGQKLKVDSMDLDALAEIIGDFMGTLRRTETLLNKYSVFRRDGRGFVTKIRWSIDAEDEVHRLTQDCAFHIAKIQFVTEPLKMKLLLDLGDQIEGVQNVLMGKLEQLEVLIRQSQGLPPPLEITGSAPPYPEIHASNVHALTSRRLEEKFEETLHYHPRFRSIDPEVPIQDYTEAAAWWIDNGTGQFSKQKIYGSQLVPADLYLNFLKAAWLLKRCEKSAIYRRLDKNSLWCEYICGLLESISTEIKSFSERELSIPDEDSLLRLPDDCFLMWLNKPEKEVVLGIRDERPGEEKILQLTLETTLDPERFTRELLVFRKGEETLRLCDTTDNFENGSRSSEEFVVNCAETQLIAVYIAGYNPRAPVLNVLMRNRLQNREYSFKAPRDLHDFQRAIVGAQVMFDQPGSREIICAPRIGTGQQGSNVRTQMWLDKPLARQPIPFPSPDPSTSGLRSPPPSPRPPIARTMTNSSSGSSSNSANHPSVMEFRLPTAPRLIIYYKTRDHRWSFLQVPMEESLAIKPKRCCGNNMKRLFAGSSSSETCCRRTVLESEKKGGGVIEALLFLPQKGVEPELTIDVLRANVGRAKKNAEKVAFKYISIEFADDKEKLRFNKAFEDVKKLRKAQRLRTDRMMLDAKRQAYVSGSSGGGGGDGGIQKSMTWSSEGGSFATRYELS